MTQGAWGRAQWVVAGVVALGMGAALAAADLLLAGLALTGVVAVGWLVVRAWAADVPQVAQVPGKAKRAAEPALPQADRVDAVSRMASALPEHLVADAGRMARLTLSPAPRSSSEMATHVAALREGVGR